MTDNTFAKLQDLGYEFGCPTGINIIDWLRHKLNENKQLQEQVKVDSLTKLSNGTVRDQEGYHWNLKELVIKLRGIIGASIKGRTPEDELIEQAIGAIAHLMALTTDLHRRAQIAESPLHREMAKHKREVGWSDSSARQSFRRMSNAHKEIKRIYDQFRRVRDDGCDDYGYNSVMDSASVGPTIPGAVYANRYVSKRGGIVSVRVADIAELIVEELLALRALNNKETIVDLPVSGESNES